MNTRVLVQLIWVLLISPLLGGCVAVPVSPGDDPWTRGNISGVVPDFIERNKTSRVEVLLKLGEPDRILRNGERFEYERKTSLGGMYVFAVGTAGIFPIPVAGSEAVTLHCLVIEFDEEGRVANAKAKTETASGYSTPAPCVASVAGEKQLELPPGLGQTFAPASWSPGAPGFRYISPERPAVSGGLIIGERDIHFFAVDIDGAMAALVKVSYDQIADVYVDRYGVNRSMVIKLLSGAYESFSVHRSRFMVDRELTESAGELARSRWQAAKSR